MIILAFCVQKPLKMTGLKSDPSYDSTIMWWKFGGGPSVCFTIKGRQKHQAHATQWYPFQTFIHTHTHCQHSLAWENRKFFSSDLNKAYSFIGHCSSGKAIPCHPKSVISLYLTISRQGRTRTFPCSTSSYVCVCVCVCACNVCLYVNVCLVDISLQCKQGKNSQCTCMENCFREWVINYTVGDFPHAACCLCLLSVPSLNMNSIQHYLKQSFSTKFSVVSTCLMHTHCLVTVSEFMEVRVGFSCSRKSEQIKMSFSRFFSFKCQLMI